MNFLKINKNILTYSIIIGFLTIIYGSYIGEDALGGARNDYLFHEKYIINFYNNFNEAFDKFGENYEVRNSPIFFMLASLFLKLGVDIEYLKYLNLIVVLLIVIFLTKTLNLKFGNLSIISKTFLISIVFLSPTIRSIAAWPYPIIYAILFFLISIFYFLKFKKTSINKKKLKYCLLNIFFLALSAYFTPNFGIFSIFYLFYFLKYYRFSKETILIICSNIILSLPALYFLISKDFYLFKHEAEHVISNYSIYDTINISNKIVIISSIIFFFFIPLIEIKKIKLQNSFQINLLILLFIFFNIYFYSFSSGLGGGFFYHFSNFLINGPFLLFIIFGLAIFLFNSYGLLNFNNVFLFFLLIFYNIQSTIYLKYYDPIIFFIIFFLFKFKEKLKPEKISKKYFIFYLFFLIISFGKKFVIY